MKTFNLFMILVLVVGLALVVALVPMAQAETTNVVLGGSVAALAAARSSNSEQYLGSGSWHSILGDGKIELYIDPTSPPFDSLGSFTIDNIKSFSYVTKNGGTPSNVDFYINIYTQPYTGGDATWYGNRLTAEPLYANNYSAPINTWNTWTTDSGTNQLTLFDSNHGPTGFYGAPTLADVQAGPIKWSDWVSGGDTTPIDYANQTVKYIVLATGSAWASVFEGYVDALTIELSTGPSLTIDLEHHPSEVWVDDDWAGTVPGTDPDGAGPATSFGYDAFATIQEGIDAVSGSTVHVAAGTYNENILVNKAVSLVGADRAVTIIDGNNAGNTVTITASDVSLSGFTVSGGYSGGGNIWHPYGGVVVDGNGGASALTNVTLNDNIIDGNSGNGVYVSAAGHGGPADNIAITNCTISNNGSDAPFFGGISLTYGWFDGGGTCDLGPGEAYDEWRRPKNVLIEGNDIVNAPTTGYVYGVYVNAGQNNTLRSNEIHGFSAKGLLIAASMPCTAIPCEYTTVQSNAIYDNAQNGVKLVSWNHHNTFVGNEIYDNGHGYTGAKDVRRYGFNFKDGDHNTLENNVIYGNKLGGLYLWGNGDPSYTWYSTHDNTITGNTISDHVAPNAHGIYIPARSGYPNGGFLNSTIAYNNITNNTYGFESADATQTVIAEYNWWGHASGPGGVDGKVSPGGKVVGKGDAVSGPVDWDPWLPQPVGLTPHDPVPPGLGERP